MPAINNSDSARTCPLSFGQSCPEFSNPYNLVRRVILERIPRVYNQARALQNARVVELSVIGGNKDAVCIRSHSHGVLRFEQPTSELDLGDIRIAVRDSGAFSLQQQNDVERG